MTDIAQGPLNGVRVLEIGGMGPGPFAGMTLADMGADVVRIERPGGLGVFPGDPTDDVLNRGKKSVALDLKSTAAIETALTLVESADILIEGHRPGVVEKLDIAPEDCHARNPRLVYGRMTGWGQDGPLAQRAGHDVGYIALTGALHAIGDASGPRRSRSTWWATSAGAGPTSSWACSRRSGRQPELVVGEWWMLRSSTAPRIFFPGPTACSTAERGRTSVASTCLTRVTRTRARRDGEADVVCRWGGRSARDGEAFVAFASRTAWLVTARGCPNASDASSPGADDVVAC